MKMSVVLMCMCAVFIIIIIYNQIMSVVQKHKKKKMIQENKERLQKAQELRASGDTEKADNIFKEIFDETMHNT